MNRRNPNLPAGNQPVVSLVQDYLAQADLFYVRADDVSEALQAPFNTILWRLRQANTTWEVLKRQERTVRLRRILALPGRKNVRSLARECGYAGSESFLVFFKRVMGKTFTEWRIDRQSGFADAA